MIDFVTIIIWIVFIGFAIIYGSLVISFFVCLIWVNPKHNYKIFINIIDSAYKLALLQKRLRNIKNKISTDQLSQFYDINSKIGEELRVILIRLKNSPNLGEVIDDFPTSAFENSERQLENNISYWEKCFDITSIKEDTKNTIQFKRLIDSSIFNSYRMQIGIFFYLYHHLGEKLDCDSKDKVVNLYEVNNLFSDYILVLVHLHENKDVWITALESILSQAEKMKESFYPGSNTSFDFEDIFNRDGYV